MKKTISELFDYSPGNHGLTEEIIYDFQSDSIQEKIPIYSGSQNNEVPLGFIRANCKNNKGIAIKYFTGEHIILTKDGSAGLMTYKTDEKFTLNHHACVLKLKSKWEGKVNVEWFAMRNKNHLKKYSTSRSDNMVLNTEWFIKIKFEIPSIKKQLTQVEGMNRLSELLRICSQLKNTCNDLLAKRITRKKRPKNKD